MERVRHVGEREHDHLEGHDHGEGAQAVEQLGEAGVDAGDVPGEHAAEYQYREDARHGYQHAVKEAGEEALLVYRVLVVHEAGEGLGGGQLEGRRGAYRGRLLERNHKGHEDGVHPEHADNCHYHAPETVRAFSCLCHYCCTSFLRVARSWMKDMATTIRQKMTAFAWPMPFHWTPERE